MPRTIVIGDIHGCHHELLDLCDKVGLTDEDTLVSVGDLIDRGPDPAAAIALFRSRKRSVVVCGNHERKHVRNVLSYSQQVAKLQVGAGYADAVAWFATLPYHYETDLVRVVHWGHFPGTPLDEVPEDVRAGTTSGDAKLRERYGDTPWFEHYSEDTPIVFGHAVFREPLVRRDRVYGIDTGACHGGRLTALILPERRLVSVPARGDHWKGVRDAWQEPVLRAHPWKTMPFAQISKKVNSLRDPGLTGGFLGSIDAWAAAVQACIPTLAEALDAEVARVADASGEDFGRVAAQHPAASWLQRRRAGRLSADFLGCSAPADVFALAAALGVALPVAAEP
jgi:serine/threonine protein phosphatase 1